MTLPLGDYKPYLSPSRGARAGRRVEAPVAFAGIPDGARILIGSYAGTPVHLLEALAAERGRWESLTVLCNLLLAPVPLTAFAGAPFRFLTLQPSAALRDATDAGHVEVTPARYSDCARLFTPHGALPPDAALVQVSAPGPEGRFSLGASVGAIIDAVRSAPLVIAQVNREMPYTFGAGELRRDEIDYLVEIDGPIVELTRDPPGAAAERIAEHVAALAPDEATLQFGIGAVPEAIMARLGARRDLGLHSGMISDGVMELAEHGTLTNAHKAFDRGVMIAAEVIGTQRLYAWVHRNPRVRMGPAGYTHGVHVVSRCHRFFAINSALQVALDGSVNAESIGGRQVAGPGGQPDYAEAAAAAVDGASVIALPATAAGGRASRIVRQLDAGAIVTTPRYLADRVVTEYGVAELRGRTVPDRAAALRRIAHPAFRDDLA